MSPTAGNGSSKPQTLTGRIMAAFSGPTPAGSAEGESEAPEILPPEERKAAMSTLDPMEAKWTLVALIAGHARRHRFPRLLPRRKPL